MFMWPINSSWLLKLLWKIKQDSYVCHDLYSNVIINFDILLEDTAGLLLAPAKGLGKGQKKIFLLGGRDSTKALQSSPFLISGGVPWAWRRTNDQTKEILVLNLGYQRFADSKDR